jgi:hypothetical protein
MADNPYAQYAAPEAPRELTIRLKPANPYAEFAAAAPAPSAARTAGIVSSSLSPYATAAGVGAALGAPAGGIGAIPGAVAGVGALALSDLAALGYNVVAPRFGGRPVQMPSEAISSLYQRGGMGVEPTTSEEKLLASGLKGGASALSGVGAARTIGQNALSPGVQRAANWFAGSPGAQTSAGVAAGMAPTALREYADVENPYVLGGASLAASVAGGKALPFFAGKAASGVDALERIATGANVSRQALAQSADNLFENARAAGATYTPQSFDDFVQAAQRTGSAIDPRATQLAAPVRQVLDTIENYRNAPNSVAALHDLRQNINDVLQGPLSARAGTVIRNIRDDLDDYISTPANVRVASGDPTAGQQLLEGISTYKRSRLSDEILQIAERAALNTSTPFSSSVRTQFKQLADPKHPGRLAGFTEAERETIRSIARGGSESQFLKLLSSMAPSQRASVQSIPSLVAGGLTYAGTSDPLAAAAAAAGMYGVGRVAQGGQNVLARSAVNNLAAGVRRGDVQAPTFTSARDIAGRALPQALLQSQSPYGELNMNSMAR